MSFYTFLGIAKRSAQGAVIGSIGGTFTSIIVIPETGSEHFGNLVIGGTFVGISLANLWSFRSVRKCEQLLLLYRRIPYKKIDYPTRFAYAPFEHEYLSTSIRCLKGNIKLQDNHLTYHVNYKFTDIEKVLFNLYEFDEYQREQKEEQKLKNILEVSLLNDKTKEDIDKVLDEYGVKITSICAYTSS